MRTKVKVQIQNFRKRQIYCWILVGNAILFILLFVLQQFPSVVENFYSRGFYPYFSYLPKLLFSWLPFSMGDLFYGVIVGFLCYHFFMLLISCFKKHWQKGLDKLLLILCISASLYAYFYVSWGMNYYRQPLHQQMGLHIPEHIEEEDYLRVVDKYIQQANHLRAQIVLEDLNKEEAKEILVNTMKTDSTFAGTLSKTQVKVKSPLSSELVSHFTVAGYFNPFTHDVQVNEKIYIASYPFTVVHELSHQMGIGFEDECNFIAFLKLKNHPNPWYAYSVSYETLKYLLRAPYFRGKEKYQAYYGKLSDEVKADYEAERALWLSYSGWINRVSDFFYSGYLKHNNQPEGMARYSMMSRLVVAWEMKP